MAYAASGLTRLGGGGGNALWMYSSTDAVAAVNTQGYFNDASDMLNVRDVIIVIDTSTPATNLVNVLSNASGVVDVSNGLAITETDSD